MTNESGIIGKENESSTSKSFPQSRARLVEVVKDFETLKLHLFN